MPADNSALHDNDLDFKALHIKFLANRAQHFKPFAFKNLFAA